MFIFFIHLFFSFLNISNKIVLPTAAGSGQLCSDHRVEADEELKFLDTEGD